MSKTLGSLISLTALVSLFGAGASAATLPRPEYPRPDLVRAEWLNLNGEWEFALDPSGSGEERGLPVGAGFDRKILVPFAPESPLSGVGFTDFISAAWYKRTFGLPSEWRGKRILLHFEACDYATTVWVNGAEAGAHEGGYTPFTLDITDLLKPDGNFLVVRARDDLRSGRQPSGKQSVRYESYSCFYRRTTGIWQTVWLEPVSPTFIESYRVSTDIDNGSAEVTVRLNRAPEDGILRLLVTENGRKKYAGERTASGLVTFMVPLKDARLWDVRRPNLYDIEIVFKKERRVEDKVGGYFGMRKVEVRGNTFYLNNRPLFLRTVLDQGFYPDGIYTAPSDEALKRDIELSMSLGFDGARLHQRTFERRYLAWADELGYLVWGEFADWGLDLRRPDSFLILSREWTEALERDINHPSVIGWCPFNERWDENFRGVIEAVFKLTKSLDPSRPVIDASGGYHETSSDIFDAHNYDQNAESFKAAFDGLLLVPPVVFVNGEKGKNVPYAGQPYYVSEYGGIWWNPGQADAKAWGYGDRPKSLEEFLDRYKNLTESLMANPAVAGFCYTQLYDVEQEVNGLLTFDRRPKHDPEYFRKINRQTAAIERPAGRSSQLGTHKTPRRLPPARSGPSSSGT